MQSRKTSTTTGNVELVPAPGVYAQIVVTSIVISNSDAVDSEVDLKSATTIGATFPAPNLGGCVAINLKDPFVCSVNEALNFAATVAVTTMKVTVFYHIIPYGGEASVSFVISSGG